MPTFSTIRNIIRTNKNYVVCTLRTQSRFSTSAIPSFISKHLEIHCIFCSSLISGNCQYRGTFIRTFSLTERSLNFYYSFINEFASPPRPLHSFVLSILFSHRKARAVHSIFGRGENRFIFGEDSRVKSKRRSVSAIVIEPRPCSVMMGRLIATCLPATCAYRYS